MTEPIQLPRARFIRERIALAETIGDHADAEACYQALNAGLTGRWGWRWLAQTAEDRELPWATRAEALATLTEAEDAPKRARASAARHLAQGRDL